MSTKVSSRMRTTAAANLKRNRGSPTTGRRALFSSPRSLGRVVKQHLSTVTSTSSDDNGETEAYLVEGGVAIDVGEKSHCRVRNAEKRRPPQDEDVGGVGHTWTTSSPRRPSSDDDPNVHVVPIVDPDDEVDVAAVEGSGSSRRHPHNLLRNRTVGRSVVRGGQPPTNDPAHWPQRPLLLRATPGSGTVVRGVRYSGSEGGTDDYLPPERSPGGGCDGGDGGGEEAIILPINDGTEAPGRCLVVDFETELFEGTAMLRIRGAGCAGSAWGGDCDGDGDGDGCGNDDGDDGGGGYFDGRKRRFQAVVRGRFRRPGVPMSECVTGQLFDRPAGRLPGMWVLRSAVAFINLLSPNLQADFGSGSDSSSSPRPRPPRFLSPLVPTAQTISSLPAGGGNEWGERQGYRADRSIEDEMTEPADESSLLFDLVAGDDEKGRTALAESLRSTGKESARIRARKNAYNRNFRCPNDDDTGRVRPTFRTDREYTFEFFQHLLVFAGGGDGDEDDDDGGLAIDLGSTLGRYRLAGVLDGQPLKFMAAHRRGRRGGVGAGAGAYVDGDDDDDAASSFGWLWSFEIWHECLYSDAMRHADSSSSSS